MDSNENLARSDLAVDFQTLMNVIGLRLPVYMTSIQKAINTEVILQLMAKVSWDIKDVKSQHSQYVEVLLRVGELAFEVIMSKC